MWTVALLRLFRTDVRFSCFVHEWCLQTTGNATRSLHNETPRLRLSGAMHQPRRRWSRHNLGTVISWMYMRCVCVCLCTCDDGCACRHVSIWSLYLLYVYILCNRKCISSHILSLVTQSFVTYMPLYNNVKIISHAWASRGRKMDHRAWSWQEYLAWCNTRRPELHKSLQDNQKWPNLWQHFSWRASPSVEIVKGCLRTQRWPQKTFCNFHHGTKHASRGRIAETLTPRAVTCSPHEIWCQQP